MQHTPVLLQESIDLLNLKPGETVFDLTLGNAGHASVILERISPGGCLVGVDQDDVALNIARETLKDTKGSEVLFLKRNFRDLDGIVEETGKIPDVIFADIGFSSMQIDDPTRGFSIRFDGPLDMRMDMSLSLTARDLLLESSADELQYMFINLGELDRSLARRIAQSIVQFRKTNDLSSTFQLVSLVTAENKNKKQKNPAVQVFQSLRIAVNEELVSLERMLQSSFNILSHSGRLGVITFHSLEDRRVKDFMKHWARSCFCPPKQMVCTCHQTFPKRFKIIKPFPASPNQKEIDSNPRSRSALLRVAQVVVSE